MILSNIKGRPTKITHTKYSIKWDNPSRSIAQFNTKQFFKNYWLTDVVCEEFKIPGSKLRIDLINFTKKIVVETSGRQHEKFVKFFHKNRVGFLKSIKRDFKKINWIESNGFTFLEIYDSEVKDLSADFLAEKFNLIL